MNPTRRSIFRTCTCGAVFPLFAAAMSHQTPARAQQLEASQVPGPGASGAQNALSGPSDALLKEVKRIYKDIHANPELSMQERRTAGIAADWLRQQGYEVAESVGGTGVFGVLRNGEGATVLLRADMDALRWRKARAFLARAPRPAPTRRPARRPRSRTPAGTTCTWRG